MYWWEFNESNDGTLFKYGTGTVTRVRVPHRNQKPLTMKFQILHSVYVSKIPNASRHEKLSALLLGILR